MLSAPDRPTQTAEGPDRPAALRIERRCDRRVAPPIRSRRSGRSPGLWDHPLVRLRRPQPEPARRADRGDGTGQGQSRTWRGSPAGGTGGFKLIGVGSPEAARHSVRSQQAVGALVVPASGPNTIVTAGAEGVQQQQVLTAALTAASTSMHRTANSVDVAPLSESDRSGLSSFVFGLGLLIPSILGSVGLFLLGMRRRLWWRVAAAKCLCAAGSGGWSISPGHNPWRISERHAELLAIGFLGALSYVLFVAALQAVVGLPGTALAAIAFIFVGNAVSGGSVPIGIPSERVPPNRALAAEQRDRLGRARCRLLQRSRPGPRSTRARNLASRCTCRTCTRRPPASVRASSAASSSARDLPHTGRRAHQAAAARPRCVSRPSPPPSGAAAYQRIRRAQLISSAAPKSHRGGGDRRR